MFGSPSCHEGKVEYRGGSEPKKRVTFSIGGENPLGGRRGTIGEQKNLSQQQRRRDGFPCGGGGVVPGRRKRARQRILNPGTRAHSPSTRRRLAILAALGKKGKKDLKRGEEGRHCPALEERGKGKNRGSKRKKKKRAYGEKGPTLVPAKKTF